MNTRMHVLILLSTILFAGNSLQRAASPFPGAKGSPTLQLQPDYTCPDNADNPKNISWDMLRVILESPLDEDHRINTGINHLTVNDITLLKSATDGYVCFKLNQKVEIMGLLGERWRVTYYKVGEFYFIVHWFDGSRLGFSPVWVFNTQFELTGLWAV